MANPQQPPTVSSSSIQDVLTTLRILEKTSYETQDYLQAAWDSPACTEEDQAKTPPLVMLSESQVAATAASDPPSVSSQPIIVLQQWRMIMAEWIFELVDFFDYPREAAAVSMNYLDRTMSALRSSGSAPPSKLEFQRIFITCSYVALKLACRSIPCLSAAQMALISRGLFTEERIVASERELLERLRWRLHPPVGHSFLECYAKLLQAGNDLPVCWELIFDDARYLVELALLDTKLAMQRPSLIALAALLNALSDSELSASQLAVVSANIGTSLLMGDDQTPDLSCIRCCQVRLQVLQSEQEPDETDNQIAEDMRLDAPSSPSSVARLFQL